MIDAYSKAFVRGNYLISRGQQNFDNALGTLLSYLPVGTAILSQRIWLPDQPERFLRRIDFEKVLLSTREEIPYSIAVVIEQMKIREEKAIIDIDATIYVERPSQKGILIGKSGAMLKRIGALARKEIETLLGSQVFLTLWVKVRKNWRMDEHDLRMFGYDQS